MELHLQYITSQLHTKNTNYRKVQVLSLNMTTKKNLSKGLSGVGNKAYHQYIISDLIFGVRKKMVKAKKASKFSVLSEISLSQIGYNITKNKFPKDYNIDFVVLDEQKSSIVFLAEVERANATITETLKKIETCLKQIKTIKEAYLIKFDDNGNTTFELCKIEKSKLKRIVVSSKSELLDLSLKTCMVSTRKK